MLASTTSTGGTRASAAAAAASRVATAATTTTTTTMTRCHASPPRHAARRPADHDVGHFQREPLRLDPDAPLWVFGYGSIVWKTGFEYEERRVCVARGWRRRFYQVRDETRRSLSIIVWHSIDVFTTPTGADARHNPNLTHVTRPFIIPIHSSQGSTDHRGTPDFPGRTVTLEACGDDVRCWGAAYKISPRDAPAVLDLLEIREKQYDQRILVPLHEDASDDAAVVVENALTYVATAHESNLNWLGHAPVDDIAKTIARAVGPSGASYSSHWSPYDRVRVVNADP